MIEQKQLYLEIISRLIEAIEKSVGGREFAHTEKLIVQLAKVARRLRQPAPLSIAKATGAWLPRMVRTQERLPKDLAELHRLSEPLVLPKNVRLMGVKIKPTTGAERFVLLRIERRKNGKWVKEQVYPYPWSYSSTAGRLFAEGIKSFLPGENIDVSRGFILAVLREWKRDIDSIPTTPAAALRSKEAEEDGPSPPKSFRYNGKTIDMEPKPHAILSTLWKSRRQKVADVESSVWGDESEGDSRLKSAITRANRALFEAGFPMSVKKSGSWLTLE